MKAKRMMIGTFASMVGMMAMVAVWTRGHADEPQPPTALLNNIAVVDMNRLYEQSNAPREFEQNYFQIMQDVDKRMKALEAVDQLSGAEIQEYVTLVGKFAPTENEAKRLQTLKETSQRRATELQALQTKEPASLSADDKKRMQTLFNTSRNYREREFPSLVDQLRALASMKSQTFKTDQIVQLRKAVGSYAKSKGIQHVFDNTTLIYSPNDITDKVVEKLKKP